MNTKSFLAHFVSYLIKIAVHAPAIVADVVTLKNETGHVSNAQEASDALHDVTDIATGALDADPDKQAAAQVASGVAQSIINAVTGPQTPPVAPPQGAPAAAVINSPGVPQATH